MNMLARLERWKQQGTLSPEQCASLAGVARGDVVSLSLELNVLLYAGVLAFITGLGWTISTWSRQLGDVAIVAVLTAILAASLWYCFSRAPQWSAAETVAPTALFDYVLYLGSLVWVLELGYLENRFHVLSGQWDDYLLATAILFFFFAYRFDNRFVLSLALSSLAGWFGFSISHWSSHQDASYRKYALLYCLVVGGGGIALQRLQLKPHFFGTYLNIATNVLFVAVLSGVFQEQGFSVWFVGLLLACAAAVAWGLRRRQFAFVAYAAVYGYVGVTYVLLRNTSADAGFVFVYFVFSAVAMLAGLVVLARHVGSDR